MQIIVYVIISLDPENKIAPQNRNSLEPLRKFFCIFWENLPIYNAKDIYLATAF